MLMKAIKITIFALILGLATPTPAPAIELAEIGRGIKAFALVSKLVATMKTFGARTEKDLAFWKAAGAIFDGLRCTPSKLKDCGYRDSTLGVTALTARLAGDAEKVVEPFLKRGTKNKKVAPLRGATYFAAFCTLLVELTAEIMANPDNHCFSPFNVMNRKDHEMVQIVRVLAKAIYENLLAGGDFKSLSSLFANASSTIQLAAHVARACPELTLYEKGVEHVRHVEAEQDEKDPIFKTNHHWPVLIKEFAPHWEKHRKAFLKKLKKLPNNAEISSFKSEINEFPTPDGRSTFEFITKPKHSL